MNLECLNGIITDNLAIQIDLTQLKSWDLNSGFTAFSLTKWVGAVSDNINLIDFGLTEFDNGRTNLMWTGITLTPADTLFSMYRIGYNEIINPSTGNTSGYTATTSYNGYDISGVTSGAFGNYFNLNGGYLQGFFKLDGYNYELLPKRYGRGITIETLVNLIPNSQGIFYMMGARAEDKYNQYFSGETLTGFTTITTGRIPTIKQVFTGITTSLDNYIDSFENVNILNKGFRDETLMYRTEYIQPTASGNTSNNAIAFELTSDKHIKYKYIDNKGNIVSDTSVASVTTTGFTIIDIVFSPNIDDILTTPFELECTPQRRGKMIFYINGRAIWIIHDFPEFYFKPFRTEKELQIGEPYSISWGGGSFGLKHSWHYDYQTYVLYKGQDTNYINNNFFVEPDPISTECYIPPTGNTYLSGLTLSADTTTFKIVDKCTGDENPITVMRIEYTGTTSRAPHTYFVKFNHPITVLSNREYEINFAMFNGGFFKQFDSSGNTVNNRVVILAYGDVDLNIHKESQYVLPMTQAYMAKLLGLGLHPFPDFQEYQYMLNGLMYFGVSGLPVSLQYMLLQGLDIMGIPVESFTTGEDVWLPIKTVFSTEENSGKKTINIGLLIESDQDFNNNSPLYIGNFTYKGADILVQDSEKNNLLIEENFNSSFIGGIQKLRVYNNALTSPEVLHNALAEAKINSYLNLPVSKGGRIINTGNKVTQYQAPIYFSQQTSGSDIRKTVRYRNTDGTYKDLYQMIDVKVIVASRTNPTVELIKFKKVAVSGITGWTGLIYVNDTTYDFIVPNTITSLHPNEILFAEIKFQWTDPLDIDGVFDKIFVVDITTKLLDDTIKNY